jgi:hypothetical protein
MKPPKRKAKKRARPSTAPVDLLDQARKDEIEITFQHALTKGESKSIVVPRYFFVRPIFDQFSHA